MPNVGLKLTTLISRVRVFSPLTEPATCPFLKNELFGAYSRVNTVETMMYKADITSTFTDSTLMQRQ